MKASKAETRAQETRKATDNMRELIVRVKSLLEADLREEGLSLAQLRMLKAVGQHSNVSSAELARVCLVTPQSLQALLTRAVREGWITRSHSLTNDRILTASLTPAGQELLGRGLAVFARLEERMWSGIRAGELREFNRVLENALSCLQDAPAAHGHAHR